MREKESSGVLASHSSFGGTSFSHFRVATLLSSSYQQPRVSDHRSDRQDSQERGDFGSRVGCGSKDSLRARCSLWNPSPTQTKGVRDREKEDRKQSWKQLRVKTAPEALALESGCSRCFCSSSCAVRLDLLALSLSLSFSSLSLCSTPSRCRRESSWTSVQRRLPAVNESSCSREHTLTPLLSSSTLSSRRSP